ncbi:hypothetical protein [Inediibacterium massiliense]|uniref:hypothetical protein n=1 Tax=Inediibacterium massiliense TaxID=1658111 RepID=UPI0018FEE97C|nr:hypothetical protein [Inediibacterium massiliense]
MTRIKVAREEGIEEGKVELVKNLLLVGVDIEKIIKAAGFTKEDIENIEKKVH